MNKMFIAFVVFIVSLFFAYCDGSTGIADDIECKPNGLFKCEDGIIYMCDDSRWVYIHDCAIDGYICKVDNSDPEMRIASCYDPEE